MSLWLAENPIDSQHVVKDFIEQHQWHVQFFFIEYLVKIGQVLIKTIIQCCCAWSNFNFWDVLTDTKAHRIQCDMRARMQCVWVLHN